MKKIIICKGCGIERLHHAKNFCSTCYTAKLRAEHRGKPCICVSCKKNVIHYSKGLCQHCYSKIEWTKDTKVKNEKYKQYRLSLKEKNIITPEFLRFHYRNLKYGSKVRGRELDMCVEDFVEWGMKQTPICFYCRHPVELNGGRGNINLFTLDRLDCKGSYRLNNIVFCCFMCNLTRRDIFSVEEMKQLGASIEKIKNERKVL